MAFRCRVSFRWGAKGWTENWYIEGGARSDAMTKMQGYVTQRRKSLYVQAAVKRITVSNVDPPRDGIVYTYLGNTGAGGAGPVNDTVGAEAPNAAVNVRYIGSTAGWRNLLVRGLPQEAIAAFDDPDTISVEFRDMYINTFRYVRDNDLRFKRRTYPHADEPITAVRQTAGIISGFTFANPPAGALVVGDELQVRGNLGLSNATGYYRVVAVLAGNEYLVAPRQRQSFGTFAAGTGRARKVVPVYEPMNDISFIGVTSRKTGRPSDQPRGRASVRRR